MSEDVITALRHASARTQPPAPFDLDGAIRKGRRRVRRTRIGGVGAAAAAAAAMVVAGIMLPGSGFDASVPPGSAAEKYKLALLDGPAPSPEEINPYAVGILTGEEDPADLSTIRVLDTPDDEFDYLVSINSRGELCFVLAMDDPGLAGGGCNDASAFHRNGAWRSAGTTSIEREAWLIPDGFEFDPRGPGALIDPEWEGDGGPEYELIHPNLAVRTP